MADEFKVITNGTLALTQTEIDVLQSMLDSHDRGGFHTARNAMADSSEAVPQTTFATLSPSAGGTADRKSEPARNCQSLRVVAPQGALAHIGWAVVCKWLGR